MAMQQPGLTPTQLVAVRSEQNLADLVARRATLRADLEYIQDEVAAIDAQLIGRLPVGTTVVGGAQVQVREYTRVDMARVGKDYPADSYPGLYVTKTVLDDAAVKKQFSPAVLESYKMHGKRSVTVR